VNLRLDHYGSALNEELARKSDEFTRVIHCWKYGETAWTNILFGSAILF